jgi:hypothetical protein
LVEIELNLIFEFVDVCRIAGWGSGW